MREKKNSNVLVLSNRYDHRNPEETETRFDAHRQSLDVLLRSAGRLLPDVFSALVVDATVAVTVSIRSSVFCMPTGERIQLQQCRAMPTRDSAARPLLAPLLPVPPSLASFVACTLG